MALLHLNLALLLHKTKLIAFLLGSTVCPDTAEGTNIQEPFAFFDVI